ncbi:hypothetical protein [Thalassomonas sp. RHCl1]|uniref:hypothetical protein n=1 Tax=Thalassomonas sp. RHCl1 TaxID=2995320 RepID=UPI00248C2214|nr:hypothetical protein [Thalassomonas sp. RHCl1]
MKSFTARGFIRLVLLVLAPVHLAYGDGVVVDKVYHPYVLPNETEVEWRLLSHRQKNSNSLGQRFAFGHSLSETIMAEFYVVGERDDTNDFGLQAYEIEIRQMLTQQGQYWADWGMLYEVEKQHDRDNWEVSTGVLFEKEFGKTSLTMNLFGVYEWGQDLKDEFETEFRLKYRYRWIPAFQPAIEFYTGQDFTGAGPAFMGIHRFSGQKQLKWEAAFISALNTHSKNHTFRMAIEYEF